MLLSFENVFKSYGPTRALDDFSMHVGRNEIVAVLGPNGAGKTTALEIAVGLRSPSSGSVRLFGESPRESAARVRLGVTPQNTGFPDTLRVRELVGFVATQYPQPLVLGDVLMLFGLTDIAEKKLGDLSGGQQRRVALALAFTGDPELAVLDEPTTGLDVESRRGVLAAIRRRVSDRCSVLFTTHYLEEAESLATRVLVIDAGRLLFDGTPAALREQFGHKRVEYVGADGPVLIRTADADALVRELVASGAAFSDLRIATPTLEEAFVAITGGDR
jgi:ABC-2 type transport system ATP-binding protein